MMSFCQKQIFLDINDSIYYDEVLPILREAFQGIVFAQDDYNYE